MRKVDSKFIKPIKKISLLEIVTHIEATVVGDVDTSTLITNVADLPNAQRDEISFISKASYLPYLQTTQAYAVIAGEKIVNNRANYNLPFLLVADPYIAFAQAMQLFYNMPPHPEYIADNATISKDAHIGKGCYIAEGAYIGPNVVIGDNVYIGPNAVISQDARIGNNCTIYGLVSIKFANIGNNCIFHEGARIGQDGFGFAPSYTEEGHVKIPQVGEVIIEDNVEIGANTCIDRGAINSTIIRKGTKIDNLVQIAHNVKIGQNCFLGGQVGIAGSTIIEDNVGIAGQSGLAPHITISAGAQIAPKSGVFRNIPPNAKVMGSPTRNFYDGMRLEAIFNQLLKGSKNIKKGNDHV